MILLICCFTGSFVFKSEIRQKYIIFRKPNVIILNGEVTIYYQFWSFINQMIISKFLKLPGKFYFASKRTSTKLQINEQQKQVTKTYLEAIQPKQMHQLIQKSENTTHNLIKQLKQLIKQNKNHLSIKEVHKKIQKSIKYLEPHHLKDLIRLNSEYNHPALSHLYDSVVKHLQNHFNELEIQTLINVVYQMAKCNKREQFLMRQLDSRILDDGVPLKYDMIRKLLYTYTHLDIGTATLYSTITRTIKLGYHELQPFHLAEFAYHLSKVSDNAKGGYGVFKIAEEVTLQNIYRLNFGELVDICKFMISQNIGSNNFQLSLEEQIFKKFPPTKQINLNQLKDLLHSTSGYNFKFKDNSLGQLLQNQTLKNMKYATLQQANMFLWSWGRGKRGGKQLWDEMSKYFLQKVQLLNPRQLSFNYYSMTKSSHNCDQVLQKMQQAFSRLDFKEVNKHYLLKFLQGMHQRRAYNSNLFQQISKVLIQRLINLSPKEFINFLKILNQSDFDYQTQNIDDLKNLLKRFQSKITTKLSSFKVSDIVQILYLWTKLNIPNSEQFVSKLVLRLQDVNGIPKQCFLKGLFSLIIKDQYKLAYQMIQILFELRTYGPIGYFFSPYQYPLLAYSVYTYYVKGRDKKSRFLSVDSQAMNEIRHYFFELDPRSLNNFVQKIYNHTQKLIQEYQQISQ